MISLFVLMFGVMGYQKLNNETFPSLEFGVATVSTQYHGASAEEVETKITKPLEDEIRTVSGVKDVRSTSQEGRSEIVIRVDIDNEDVDDVMDDLQKAVERVSDLPSDLREQPKFIQLNSSEFPAIELALTGSNKNRKRDILADEIKDILENNKQVLNVSTVGQLEREFSVRIDQEKLDREHISIMEVFNAIKVRNVNLPSGKLKTNIKQNIVLLEGKVDDVNELQDIVVRSNFSGKKIRVRDLGTVIDAMQDPNVLTSVDGVEATLIIVTKKGGSDTIKLVEDIDKKLVLVRSFLPKGYEIKIFHDEAIKVRNRMEVLNSNALVGLVLVIVFLLIFLPGRIGVIASFSLPVAILVTLGCMPLFGMNLNAVTILAMVIALGMLVDNSVVISENYTRLRQDGMNTLEAAIKSPLQFWLPISATAMTTIAAFLPMLVTRGLMGEVVKYIPIVVTCALVASLLESFFLLPMRLEFIGRYFTPPKDKQGEIKRDWFYRLSLKFEKMMNICVRRRYLTLTFFVLVISFSFFMLKMNRFILFPAEQVEKYIARYETQRGTPVEKTNIAGRLLSLEIKKVLGDDAESIVARAGVSKAGLKDDMEKVASYAGVIVIYATREASFTLNHNEVLEKLRKINLPQLKKLSFEVVLNGPPVGSSVSATLKSNKPMQLKAVTNALMKSLKETKGIHDVQTNELRGDDEIKVKFDYEKIARLGLDTFTVGKTIETALKGTRIVRLNQNNKEFDINIRLNDKNKRTINDLKNLKVLDRRGNLIPISTLAKLEERPGSLIRKHFDFRTAIVINADVDDKVITSVQANNVIKKEFSRIMSTYPTVDLVFGGQEESTNESMSSLADAMFLALIAIFAILVAVFRSFLKPLIIMTTIPLGLFGFAIAFYFHDRPVSFLAQIGIIGLTGIIVNSGIVLISFIDDLKKEGKLELHEILVTASRLRLRAVFVTSLTTMGGLFPTAYGIGGNDLILIPMTLAMAWGLTSGTIFTLVWIPCAYGILDDFLRFSKKSFSYIMDFRTQRNTSEL